MKGSRKACVNSKSEKGFLSGVIVLSLSTFIVKIIGLAYKIPMMSLLGAEGMGYFNSAYDVYALLCVISTSGLPVAISMLISACEERGRYGRMARIYRTAISVFSFLGITGSAFMILFAGRIASFVENPDIYLCMIAIAPALLFVCISSAVRGYFQGLSKMAPTAISQLIEALGKLFLGLVFAKFAIDRGYGLAVVAAFAVLGLSIGTAMSAVYLLWLKARHNKSNLYRKEVMTKEEKNDRVLSTLFKISVPITLSSAVLGVTRIIDMTLIMRRLQDIGFTSSEANTVYGSYTTLAIPVFGLIPSLIAPIALALVPKLSAAIERASVEDQTAVSMTSMRITVLFAMPSSIGVAAYSEQILRLLFPNQAEAVSIAHPLLAFLGISILFSSLITTTNSILQSYRQTTKPIISMAIGALVKVISAYILIGNRSIGIYGAPISTLLCDITVTVINLFYINKLLPDSNKVSKVYFRPFIASIVMILLSLMVYFGVFRHLNGEMVALIIAIMAAVVSYALFAVMFGAVTQQDLRMLPFGENIIKVFKRIGFWRSEKNKS